MRIDKWIRNNIGNVPQGLIEKNLLRTGKIKLNKKKVKSSVKLKLNDDYKCFLILNLKRKTYKKI